MSFMVSEETAGKFDWFAELLLAAMILPGFVIINLTISPVPDKAMVYLAVGFGALFAVVWHRVKVPLSRDFKNFIEAIVYIITIFFIVHATGGISSYFNFLYILPALDIATTSNRRFTVATCLFAAVFILGEVFLFPQLPIKPFAGLSSPYILSIITALSVGLMAAYGRYLAKEGQSSQVDFVATGLGREKSINKLKDEFVFIISHELRGPITAIRGYLDLFLSSANKDSKTPSEIKTLANNAFKQSDKLNNLISDLLDLSRLETGKFKLATEKIDLNLFLKDIVKEFQMEAEEKKIKLSFSASKENLLIDTDKERLTEVVSNLLDNALKYTGQFGQVLVWSETRGGKAFVSVADTGSGIPSEEVPFIFIRFYQPVSTQENQDINNPEKSRHVGLGLYLVKNLMEKMGGEISVDSRLGKGTKFTFNLPLAKDK